MPVCYDACPHFERYSERCRRPHGMPCPQEYDTDEEYESAVADAEWLKEQNLRFTRDARGDER